MGGRLVTSARSRGRSAGVRRGSVALWKQLVALAEVWGRGGLTRRALRHLEDLAGDHLEVITMSVSLSRSVRRLAHREPRGSGPSLATVIGRGSVSWGHRPAAVHRGWGASSCGRRAVPRPCEPSEPGRPAGRRPRSRNPRGSVDRSTCRVAFSAGQFAECDQTN